MELNKDINCQSNTNSNFSDELNTFLENNIEGATFTIDHIENGIAICENRDTKKMINIHLSKLPQNIKENDIIKYINGKYILDTQNTSTSKENIRDKFNKLRKNTTN